MVLEGEINLGNQYTWANDYINAYEITVRRHINTSLNGVTHCMDKHGVSFIRYITWRNEFKK
jgi:hypothetical protein